MSFYRERILPRLIHASMRQANLEPYRGRVAGAARGRVLEIGVGSGLNLRLYAGATHVIGLDPSPRLLAMARSVAAALPATIELVDGSAERIPLLERSVDTVVSTWTLCSIGDIQRALGEVRRVLTLEGRLLFVEHGRAPEPDIVRWQNRLTPIWKVIGGGCHLNRPIDELIAANGFRMHELRTGYMEGPRAMTFLYEGIAVPLP